MGARISFEWSVKRDAIVTDDGATIIVTDGGALRPRFRDRINKWVPKLTRYEVLHQVANDDVVRLLTPGVKKVVLSWCENLTDAAIKTVAEKCPNLATLNVSECENLTDAAIKKVAEKCPNLADLEVSACGNLTDAAITKVAERCPKLAKLNVSRCENLTGAAIMAVADKCPNLAELNVWRCENLTDAAITAVAEKCPNLAELYVGGCKNLTDASITAVAEKCPNLARLSASNCGLTALPDNIGNLSKLKYLNLENNNLTALPRSIVELDATCKLFLDGNPLQTPPLEVARRGILAMRRFFVQLDAGAAVVTQLKMVLCGDGEAGKTSLRNALMGLPNPRALPDARTILLDLESVGVPVEGDDKVKELTVKFFDLGGQENYVYAQAPFLTRHALFVLVVDANKACAKYADEAVLRFITLIQTRVPDATVQLVLSKIDDLKAEGGDVKTRCEWLWRVVKDRLEDWRKAVQKREGKPKKEIPMIHLETDVLAVSVGKKLSDSEGIEAVRDAVVRLARSKEKFPNVGQKVPLAWFEVWQFVRAVAVHGDKSKAVEAMREGTATKPLGVDDKELSAEGAYCPLDELRAAWSMYCEHVGKKDYSDRTFFDALKLLEAQGGVFVDAGLAFLNPQLIINVLKPLVDHTLTVKSDKFEQELVKFFESHEDIVPETLRNQVDSFAQSGEFGPEMLVFLWRGLPNVKHEHYGQILQVLHGSGVIFVQEKKNGNQVAVVFSHLSSNVPDKQVVDEWPEPRPEGVIQRNMTVKFYTGGCPASFVQRVIAATHRFGVSLCAWHKGVVVDSVDGKLYVQLVDEDSSEPKLVFSVRTKTDESQKLNDQGGHENDPWPWFPRVIELLKVEVELLPGLDCAALVCCARSGCPCAHTQISVWTSKRECTSNGICECGKPLLGNGGSDRRLSERALLELLIQKVDRNYLAAQQNFEAIKESRDAIIDEMLKLAKGSNNYPSVFYVVSVPPSRDDGLMQRARSCFEEKMMIVFVCEESGRAAKYGDKRGLEFSVVRAGFRNKVVEAAKFWKEHGRTIEVGASLLTIAVKAAANVNLDDLVPRELQGAVGALTSHADFLEKYSGMISNAVDKGNEYVKMIEKLEERRSRADSVAGRDGDEARIEDEIIEEMKQEYDAEYENIKEMKHEYDVNLQNFMKAIEFEREELQMEYKPLKNGNGHGWVCLERTRREEDQQPHDGTTDPARRKEVDPAVMARVDNERQRQNLADPSPSRGDQMKKDERSHQAACTEVCGGYVRCSW